MFGRSDEHIVNRHGRIRTYIFLLNRETTCRLADMPILMVPRLLCRHQQPTLLMSKSKGWPTGFEPALPESQSSVLTANTIATKDGSFITRRCQFRTLPNRSQDGGIRTLFPRVTTECSYRLSRDPVRCWLANVVRTGLYCISVVLRSSMSIHTHTHTTSATSWQGILYASRALHQSSLFRTCDTSDTCLCWLFSYAPAEIRTQKTSG